MTNPIADANVVLAKFLMRRAGALTPVERTVGELAALFKVTPQAMGLRLRTLSNDGLVTGQRGEFSGAGICAIWSLTDKGEARARTVRGDTRQWTGKRLSDYHAAPTVSLPVEPWADTVPVERVEGGQDARKPRGRPEVAKTFKSPSAARV